MRRRAVLAAVFSLTVVGGAGAFVTLAPQHLAPPSSSSSSEGADVRSAGSVTSGGTPGRTSGGSPDESPDESPGSSAPARDDAVETPNAADLEFTAMMVPHHRQAVELAAILAGTPGVDDTSLALAAFIERDQTAEIDQMQDWLDAWSAAGTSHHGTAAMAGMAGMATPEQVAALDALEGVDAERRFLELMIAHHEGALEMTEPVLREGRNSFVRSVAKHVASEQQREIEAMTVRLGTLARGDGGTARASAP